jgi:hypothetical protein
MWDGNMNGGDGNMNGGCNGDLKTMVATGGSTTHEDNEVTHES